MPEEKINGLYDKIKINKNEEFTQKISGRFKKMLNDKSNKVLHTPTAKPKKKDNKMKNLDKALNAMKNAKKTKYKQFRS